MLNNQRGSVTAMGIILIIIFTIMLAGLVPMLTTELKFTRNNRDVLEAQYAAEAGAKRAISGIVQKKPSWTWLGRDELLYTNSGEKYKVTTDPILTTTPVAGVTYQITSVGQAGNAKKTVVVWATLPESGTDEIKPIGAYINKIVSGKELSGTHADIHSVEAMANNIKSGEGQRLDNQSLSFPTYDYNTYKQSALSLPTIQMNQNYLGSNRYYKDGDLVINQNAELKGNKAVVFVNGSITISATVNINEKIFIIATGDINVQGNHSFNNVVLLAYGDINFDTEAKLQPGLVVTKATLNLKNGANINTTVSQATTLSTDFNSIMSQYALSGSGGSTSGSLVVTGWSNIHPE